MKFTSAAIMIRARCLLDSFIARKVLAPEYLHNLDQTQTFAIRTLHPNSGKQPATLPKSVTVPCRAGGIVEGELNILFPDQGGNVPNQWAQSINGRARGIDALREEILSTGYQMVTARNFASFP